MKLKFLTILRTIFFTVKQIIYFSYEIFTGSQSNQGFYSEDFVTDAPTN